MESKVLGDPSKIIEALIAEKYKRPTTTKKAIGDFMISDTHAVNVKSNNIRKQNYSPNMISIKRLHSWVYELKNDLSFIFVDYEEIDNKINITAESGLISIEHISWDCLSIEAQGYGIIQKVKPLKINKEQIKKDFYKGFLYEYTKFLNKEKNKHEKFSKKLIHFK